MQFSEDATLEKMLRSLKLSGITAPQELGGPAKKPSKLDEDNKGSSAKRLQAKSQAPSPGGFDGLFFDESTQKGPFFEGVNEDNEEDAKLRNPENGIYTCDGVHFFPRLILMERWLKKKINTVTCRFRGQ